MKKSLVFALALVVVTLSGCDMFRKIAGRPTSSEIELVRRELAVRQAKMDSLEQAKQALCDSLELIDSLYRSEGTVLNPSVMGGLYTTALGSKYYVVIGAFRQRVNAEELFNRASASGYRPVLISFRNGFNAVGLAPTDDLGSAISSLKAIKEEAFCPKDVWILVNE